MPETKFDVVMIGPFPEDPTRINGGEASVIGLSRALQERTEVARVIGFSIPLVAEKGKEIRTTQLGGIDVIYLNAPYGFLASSVVHLRRVIRMIRGLNRPVVHVHGTGLFQTAICFLLKRRRVPFVRTLPRMAAEAMQSSEPLDWKAIAAETVNVYRLAAEDIKA